MSPATISLYALAAIVGVAPALLRAALARSGVRLAPNDRASESDLARVFGVSAARAFVERARVDKPTFGRAGRGAARRSAGAAGAASRRDGEDDARSLP